MNKNIKPVFLFVPLLALLVFMVACGSEDTEKIKNATITQVLAFETIQNNGSYILDNGHLTISKKIQVLQNIDDAPGGKELTEEEKRQVNAFLNNDFPDEQVENADDLFLDFTREVPDSYIVMDETEQKTTIYGKDYKNEFIWINETGSRIKDVHSVEYSFEKEH